MLEWWHAKCAEYGEPWIPPYLTDLAQAGSTDVLDWAWDHGSRTLDYFTQCDELGSSPDPHANSPDPLKMGMYLIAVGAAEGGWTHVLDWFWEKSLFNKDDLDNSARRAAVVASRQAHIHVLEWYRLKLASRHPWSFPVHHWSLMNRSGSVAVAKWWYQHSTAYVAAFRYRQFNCQLWRFASVETFEWMHACSRRHEASKNWYTAPLNMLLTAPTADKAWFWIRYCTTNPDQVALPAYFVVDPRVTRLKHLELVRSICQQHGLDATDQFRRAMVHLKCAEAMDQWWQTHFGSTL
ncbi:hypothetical protein BC828DRAFT_381296 [Blastocladiella britannica]|nr:hypothetical protein BC828DRAFT_381296 [Blastocladiella britannica]